MSTPAKRTESWVVYLNSGDGDAELEAVDAPDKVLCNAWGVTIVRYPDGENGRVVRRLLPWARVNEVVEIEVAR